MRVVTWNVWGRFGQWAERQAGIEETLAEGGFTTPKDMGPAMKAINAKVAGRADGKTVADLVKARLAG